MYGCDVVMQIRILYTREKQPETLQQEPISQNTASRASPFQPLPGECGWDRTGGWEMWRNRNAEVEGGRGENGGNIDITRTG